MNRKIFSVYDAKADSFGQPMFVVNEAVMFRMMKDEVLRGGADNLVAKHPQDFAVYLIGEFNDESGMICGDKPVIVFRCEAFVEVKDGC